MKLISATPFIAVIILGIFVFSTHPSLGQRTNYLEWKSNQQILLLIENCQDGQMNIETCKAKIPTVLDECKSFHVLACNDQRLLNLLDPNHLKIGIN